MAQSHFAVRVVKNIFACFQIIKRHICMHTGAANSLNRLGHKGCVKSVLCCISLYNMLKCHNSVGGGHNLAELEVNLVLSLCNLVMRRLNSIAHFLKCKADISTAILTVIDRIKVKIACFVACLQGRNAILIQLEKEEFTFRSYVKAVAHFSRLVNNLLEHVSRIALKRSYVICFIYRADKSCCLSIKMLSPRKNCPGVIIRVQIHIGLVNSNEAVNR